MINGMRDSRAVAQIVRAVPVTEADRFAANVLPVIRSIQATGVMVSAAWPRH